MHYSENGENEFAFLESDWLYAGAIQGRFDCIHKFFRYSK